MFKWEIKIGKKPRGLWRPEVAFRILIASEDEYRHIKALNVSEEYVTEFGTACENYIWECEKCKKNVYARLGFALYGDSSPRENWFACPPRKLELAKYYTAHLEWRPGKADYSDIVEKIRVSIIQPAIDWFQSQLAEAEASEPIEEIIISSDCITNTTTKGGEKPLPTRKVKI